MQRPWTQAEGKKPLLWQAGSLHCEHSMFDGGLGAGVGAGTGAGEGAGKGAGRGAGTGLVGLSAGQEDPGNFMYVARKPIMSCTLLSGPGEMISGQCPFPGIVINAFGVLRLSK